MKRIVHITTVHKAFDSRIFFKECRSLAATGLAVTLIAPHARDEFYKGIQIKALPTYSRRFKRVIFGPLRAFFMAWRLRAHLYHFHDPELIPAGVLLKFLGKCVIYDIHEDVPRSLMAASRDYIPQGLKKTASLLVEKFENFASRLFAALITATPKIADRFENRNSHTTVIFNFPILDEFKKFSCNDLHKRPGSIAYIGGISLERGIHKMIEVINLMPAALSSNLIMAGRFSPPQLENDMRALPGWRRIDYRGWVPRDQIAEILGQSRLGLLLLHPLPSFMDSYPIKLFEYMAAGIPVVASHFPLWQEIIEKHHCGICVDPNNGEEILNAIQHLLNHPDDAELMGRNGRQAVERNFSWQSEEKKLILLYNRILNLQIQS